MVTGDRVHVHRMLVLLEWTISYYLGRPSCTHDEGYAS